jgi:hypothetical protein
VAERKATDLPKPDGIIFDGDRVGHESRIRRHDGLIFKGDAVGQAQGTSATAKDGIICSVEPWGCVDDDGNIRQRDGGILRRRIIDQGDAARFSARSDLHSAQRHWRRQHCAVRRGPDRSTYL